MGWLITAAVLFVLAILPLGVDVKYDADGVFVCVIAGPVRLRIIPAKKKKAKKPKKDKPAKQKPAKNASKEEPKVQTQEVAPVQRTQAAAKPAQTPPALPEPPKPPKKKGGGSITDFLPLVQLALDFLGDFRRKLRLNRLQLKLILAGGDPCDLALNYGRANAALANLEPLLERVFVIRKRDMEVECDFQAADMTIVARLDITITLGRLIALVVVYGVRGLIEFLKLKKKRKGGALK